MKLTLFGASGRTGLQVVEQGLAAGHEVRAVVRDRTAFPDERDGLEVVVADVMDSGAIVEAVRDRDAVISAIGTRADARRPPSAPTAPEASLTQCTRRARSGSSW